MRLPSARARTGDRSTVVATERSDRKAAELEAACPERKLA